jgi:uncharacterized protein YuzE
MSVTIGDWTFNHVVYDDEVDVLYLSLDEPHEGHGEETPEGDIWRFDEDGQFNGITIMGIRRRSEGSDGTTITLPRREVVETSDLEDVVFA